MPLLPLGPGGGGGLQNGATIRKNLAQPSPLWSAPGNQVIPTPDAGVAADVGTADSTEAQDTATFTGSAGFTGTLVATEAVDTASLSGGSTASGSIGATEAADSFASSASLVVTGTMGEVPTAALRPGSSSKAKRSFDETGANFSSSAVKFDATTLSESLDTGSFSGTVANPAITGTLAATDAQDVATLTATLVFSGDFAAIEPTQDSMTASGATSTDGALAGTDAPDTAAMSGDSGSAGSLAIVEPVDTAAIVASAGFDGSLGGTDAQDSATAAGQTASAGTLAASEAMDALVLAGGIEASGTFALVEAPDTLVASETTPPITGRLGSGPGFDSSAIRWDGSSPTFDATTTVVENPDTASFTAPPATVDQPAQGGGGSAGVRRGGYIVPYPADGELEAIEKPDTIELAGSVAAAPAVAVREPIRTSLVRAVFSRARPASKATTGTLAAVEASDTVSTEGEVTGLTIEDRARLRMIDEDLLMLAA